jgi:hypothetical protein
MTGSLNQSLSTWTNFYVVVGASAGTLIGVQFVVIALIASTRTRANMESVNAFGTPTVVHFCGAMAISALMSAPWPSPLFVSVVLGVYGICALGYGFIVVRRANRQTVYKPVLEDWIWYSIFPCSTYAAITAAALVLPRFTTASLFVVAGATLFLLIVGIHNAWDSVTHIVLTGVSDDVKKSE